MNERTLYQRVKGADYRRIYVCGDIHGCYSLLIRTLSRVDFDYERDLLICTGDIIDRGPESLTALDLLTAPWFKSVRGNHEQMAIDVLRGDELASCWLANGGTWYFNSDPDEQRYAQNRIADAAQLPHVIEVTTKKNRVIVIAHADYPSTQYRYDKPLPNFGVLWNRDRWLASATGESHDIEGAEMFIFGHTPVVIPTLYANQMYIDTGAVRTGLLTLFAIQE